MFSSAEFRLEAAGKLREHQIYGCIAGQDPDDTSHSSTDPELEDFDCACSDYASFCDREILVE